MSGIFKCACELHARMRVCFIQGFKGSSAIYRGYLSNLLDICNNLRDQLSFAALFSSYTIVTGAHASFYIWNNFRDWLRLAALFGGQRINDQLHRLRVLLHLEQSS